MGIVHNTILLRSVTESLGGIVHLVREPPAFCLFQIFLPLKCLRSPRHCLLALGRERYSNLSSTGCWLVNVKGLYLLEACQQRERGLFCLFFLAPSPASDYVVSSHLSLGAISLWLFLPPLSQFGLLASFFVHALFSFFHVFVSFILCLLPSLPFCLPCIWLDFSLRAQS